jgi:hypothetical protein
MIQSYHTRTVSLGEVVHVSVSQRSVRDVVATEAHGRDGADLAECVEQVLVRRVLMQISHVQCRHRRGRLLLHARSHRRFRGCRRGSMRRHLLLFGGRRWCVRRRLCHERGQQMWK